MSHRGEWGTRTGFILAAIGSAVGLGNIWRFPYMVASNGGGAFMIVYLIALLTAGVPIMILEFSIGHKMRRSAPGAFRMLNPKWEFLGWMQVFTSFAIVVYYTSIIGWSLSYAVSSFKLSWGADTKGYFFGEFLKLTDSPFNLGGINLSTLIPLVLVWILMTIVLFGGIKKGIEKVNKILMPALLVMMVVMLIRAVTLPGALTGLDYMFKPDFSKILDPKVWIAAYGQCFFSLSVAFAIMLTYSSYLPEKSDIVNNGFMTSFADCGFALLPGITVFAVLGYMAGLEGKAVSELATAGVGLAFVVFPQIVNSLPGFNSIFGVLFFLSLAFAGFTSAISIAEVVIAAIIDKFAIPRKKAVLIIVSIAGVVSLIFATGGGLHILDIVDYFVNNYNIVGQAVIEIILVAWVYKLDSLKKHANDISDFTVGKWWDICLKFITPIILTTMLILKFINDVQKPYGDYPNMALFVIGWSMPIIAIILGVVLSKLKWKKE